jgi:hypothetical protein
MHRRDISKVLLGSVAGAALLSERANAQSCTAPCYARTAAETAANVTPDDYSYPPGDIRRFGAVSGQDCHSAIQASLDSANFAFIPENFTALISQALNCLAAGQEVFGRSRYTSIIQPTNEFSAPALMHFDPPPPPPPPPGVPPPPGPTYYGLAVHDLNLRLYNPNNVNLDVTGVDLASINNATVRRVRFEGRNAGFENLTAAGVRFVAPHEVGAYANCVQDCDFSNLEFGVIVGGGGNHNIIRGGEFIHCKYGIHANPSSLADTLFVDGPRFEGGYIGVLEGMSNAVYLRCRFEAHEAADIMFTSNSSQVMIIGGTTASTTTPLVNLSAASQPCILAPDLIGLRFFGNMGFNGAAAIAKPTVTGSRGGNAALQSLLSALASYGLITNSTT